MVWTATKPRGPISAMNSTPGPVYLLPGLVGSGNHDPRSVHSKQPAYSFGLKHGKFKDESSPGPCYFPNPKISRTGKDGTPQYSLYARRGDLKADQNPGPGTYKPEEQGPMRSVFLSQPSYTFGSRHKYFGLDNTPAPNAYALPAMLGKTVTSMKKQAPMYTLTGRSKRGGFDEDLQQTPGPGTYSIIKPSIYKREPPSYSMTARNTMPGDNTSKPGPGVYASEKVWLHKPAAPGYSFGIRHSMYEAPLIVEVKE
ncbi:unnamed protein product [Didymodactylos carnosus]|uniref:Outer dense fiber protein 3 n=1 Tax=Didymodactylos carnosus TaxID=1234261 RepID=A0A814K1P5_9BILA|nr:unnamed protein product [Didymodactylos carnosus]CAF1046559.1 unnamed protein product [Didymodactylos carnosus]CAF3752442.1 unnamed protein product [Didymodactylos carnosus]CAF3816374.1 unnamed protein product [Didymodactylos carnosus]